MLQNEALPQIRHTIKNFRMKKLGAALAVATTLFFATTPPSAFAEEPLSLSDNLVDTAGVIQDPQATTAAIKQVRGADLWVVIVNNFSKIDAEKWAKRTYKLSQLADHDGLVAISVGDYELGYAGNSGTGVSRKVLDAATDRQVLDLFRAEKWDAGVQLLAQNVKTLSEGGTLAGTNRTANRTDTQGANSQFTIGGILLLIGGGIWIYYLQKKKGKEKGKEKSARVQKSSALSAAELKKLSEQAASALLHTDDALRSATAELEFARAEFGLQATQEFAQAIERAKEAVNRGFALRRILDDPHPETAPEQQEMNQEILTLAQQAEQTLAQQNQKFQELRNLAARVSQKIPELQTRITELRTQVPLAEAKITHLALKYPETMLKALRSYPAQIQTLLTAADKSLAEAHTAAQAEQRNTAVPYVKMTEETLSQAATLLTRIDTAPQALSTAQARFNSNIASLSADIDDANRLLPESKPAEKAVIENAQAAAQALILRAKETDNPDYLAFNEELQETEAALDAALSHVRAAEEVRLRYSANTESAKQNADLLIQEADDFINRYRAGISANARTLLARAKETYHQAGNLPLAQQLPQYQNATRYARQSLQEAEKSLDKHNRNESGSTDEFFAGMITSAIISGIFNSGNNKSDGNFFGGGSAGFGGGFGSGGGFGGGRKGF